MVLTHGYIRCCGSESAAGTMTARATPCTEAEWWTARPTLESIPVQIRQELQEPCVSPLGAKRIAPREKRAIV